MVGVLRELVSVFSGREPFSDVLEQVDKMLRQTADMVELASNAFWGSADLVESRNRLYDQDIEVNRLERRIRKALAKYAVAGESDATHALRLMSLVKDVERLGDYAKNLAELPDLWPKSLPDDEIVSELRRIAGEVQKLMTRTAEAMVSLDQESARELTLSGRQLAKDCDQYVKRCAKSDYDAGLAVRFALAARFYKRIAAHLLNILSSLIMPLHKLDYFDEEVVAGS